MRERALGLLCAVAVAGVATALSQLVLDPITLALLLGIALRNLIRLPTSLDAGLTFAAKPVLALAVGLLGAGISASTLGSLGLPVLGILVAAVAVPIGIAFAWPRIPIGPARLTGVGTGICGSAAIAATAPILAKDPADLGMSVGVVNLLGTVGLFVLPGLAVLLQLDPDTTAILLGSTLQSMGHVVAAGMGVSEPVGELAVAVKMGRIALLVPTVLVLGAWAGGKGKAKLSWDLGLFIALAVLANIGVLPDPVIATLKTIAKVGLTVAMAGIGLRLALRPLLKQAPAILGLGVAVWVAQIAVVLGLLLAVRG